MIKKKKTKRIIDADIKVDSHSFEFLHSGNKHRKLCLFAGYVLHRMTENSLHSDTSVVELNLFQIRVRTSKSLRIEHICPLEIMENQVIGSEA